MTGTNIPSRNRPWPAAGPPSSRALEGLTNDAVNTKVASLADIASDLGCSLAQLAIAWCAANPNVSTVITGASRVEQVAENMKALDVLASLDDDVMRRIDEVLAQ